jgi:predicted  nucleic acid-binding Zn-ribbon protein
MANPAEPLRRLQETEQRLLEVQARIAELQRTLQGDASAADSRPRLLIAEARRRELARRLEQAEQQERSERARARSHEQQLYSGAIHNPRELSQLVAELEQLKGRLATEEDEELELLAALDEAEREEQEALADASRARGELDDPERDADLARVSLAEQRTAIPQVHLRLYDRVQAYRPRPTVVEVSNGVCSGCRIPISLTQSKALKNATEPLVCETCGRILLPA